MIIRSSDSIQCTVTLSLQFIEMICYIVLQILFAVCVVHASTPGVNVGKLRSAAELALSKGEVDQSLKLWNQVLVIIKHSK